MNSTTQEEVEETLGKPASRTRAQMCAPSPPIARVLFTGTLVAVAAVICVMGAVLWKMREDAWRSAEQASQNLLVTIAGNIDSNMRVYAFALDLGAPAWEDADVKNLTDETRHRLLSNIAEKALYLEDVFVLDKDGHLISESKQFPSRIVDLSDRDYFLVHRDRDSPVHFLSAPHLSRLRGGTPFFAMSRRLNAPNGDFAGVIVMSVRLSYFAELFKSLDIGPDSEISVTTQDGKVLMRSPTPEGNAAIGADVAGTPLFARMRGQDSGSFVATVDGVERLYSFARIPAESLILSLSVSVDDILSEWRERALTIGAVMLGVCGALVSLAFMLRRELRRRAAVEADLAFLSITDGLTGLANRRRFDEIIQREWRRTQRTGVSLALLFIDVDRFKVLNDRYGHARGDEVLRVIARVIDESLRRPGDIAARYGGEEFAVILPDTDEEGAVGIAEAIRAGIEHETGRSGSRVPQATVSIGVKAIGPKANLSVEGLLECADKALYQAKTQGRNRVVRYA